MDPPSRRIEAPIASHIGITSTTVSGHVSGTSAIRSTQPRVLQDGPNRAPLPPVSQSVRVLLWPPSRRTRNAIPVEPVRDRSITEPVQILDEDPPNDLSRRIVEREHPLGTVRLLRGAGSNQSWNATPGHVVTPTQCAVDRVAVLDAIGKCHDRPGRVGPLPPCAAQSCPAPACALCAAGTAPSRRPRARTDQAPTPQVSGKRGEPQCSSDADVRPTHDLSTTPPN